MRKNLSLLVVKFAVISFILLIHSSIAYGQQRAFQLGVNPVYITLANGTQTIEMTITINAIGMKREIDNITLILELPRILKDKIILEIYKDGNIIGGNIIDKTDTFEIYFILEENIKIKEAKMLHYVLNLSLKDIDCRVLSEFISNNLTIGVYARLLLNELDADRIDLQIRVDSERFWRACFAQFLTIFARGRLDEDLLLDLSFSISDALAVERLPPFDLRILVRDYGIDECIPRVQGLTCRVKDGLALLESREMIPSGFNLTLKLPREALEKRRLEVWVNYSDIVKSVILAPELHVRGKLLSGGVLNLTLVNKGTLPYNASNFRVTPESAVKVHLNDTVIVNPGEEKQIRYIMTIVSGRSLTNQLKVTLNLSGLAHESILFIIELDKSEAKIFDRNKIMITFKLLCNGSLRLEIQEESPLIIIVERFKVLNCTASRLNCKANNSAALVYGTLDLPSNVTVSLEVGDEGGPVLRRVEVALSDELRSVGFVSIQRETRWGFERFLILAASIVALIVLAVVIALRRRAPEKQLVAGEEAEKEVYLDLG